MSKRGKKNQGLGNPFAIMAAGRAASGFFTDSNGNIRWGNVGLLGVGAFVLYQYTPLGDFIKGMGKITNSAAGAASNVIDNTGKLASSIVGSATQITDTAKNTLTAVNKAIFTDAEISKIMKDAQTSDLRVRTAFNPNYWQISTKSIFSTPSAKARLEKLAYEIYDSPANWYAWDDEEERTGAVFSAINTLEECSALTYYFNEKYKKDLFTFLNFMSTTEIFVHVWSKVMKYPNFK